jgi:ATP-dependent DNA helicase RecG
MIVENGKITIPEIAAVLKVTERTIERAINKLKKENKIERIGPDKGGYWQIKK